MKINIVCLLQVVFKDLSTIKNPKYQRSENNVMLESDIIIWKPRFGKEQSNSENKKFHRFLNILEIFGDSITLIIL